jgi:hypothetical protein
MRWIRWTIAILSGVAAALQFFYVHGALRWVFAVATFSINVAVQIWNDPKSERDDATRQRGQHRLPRPTAGNRLTGMPREWLRAMSGRLAGSAWASWAARIAEISRRRLGATIGRLAFAALVLPIFGWGGVGLFAAMSDDPQALYFLPITGSVSWTSFEADQEMNVPLYAEAPSELKLKVSYPNVMYLNSDMMSLAVKGSTCTASAKAEYAIYSGVREVDSGTVSAGDSQGQLHNVAIGARQFLRMKFTLLAPAGCSGTLSLHNPSLDKARGWAQYISDTPAGSSML